MEFRTGTQEEVIESLNRSVDDDIYPILKTNGQMLCFLPFEEYAEFIVFTGKVNAGEYLEKKHPEIFDKPINAREIIDLLRNAYKGKENNSDETINKIVKVMLVLASHNDYAQKMKEKYPREFFKNLYPFELIQGVSEW